MQSADSAFPIGWNYAIKETILSLALPPPIWIQHVLLWRPSPDFSGNFFPNWQETRRHAKGLEASIHLKNGRRSLSLISPSASEEIHAESQTCEESPKQINKFLPLNPPQNCLESGGSISIHSTSTARPSSLHSRPRHRACVGLSASPGTISVILVCWGHIPRGIID